MNGKQDGTNDQFDLFKEVKSRADQIFERFVTFHLANPEFWRLFCQYADAMRQRLPRYSAQGIFERARFEHAFSATNTDDDSLRLNNDYVAYYARMYLSIHLDAVDFFEIRKRTSENRSAFKNDISFFHNGAPVGEEELIEKLRALASLDK